MFHRTRRAQLLLLLSCTTKSGFVRWLISSVCFYLAACLARIQNGYNTLIPSFKMHTTLSLHCLLSFLRTQHHTPTLSTHFSVNCYLQQDASSLPSVLFCVTLHFFVCFLPYSLNTIPQLSPPTFLSIATFSRIPPLFPQFCFVRLIQIFNLIFKIETLPFGPSCSRFG